MRCWAARQRCRACMTRGEYDIAGFTVGVVNRNSIDGSKVRVGDIARGRSLEQHYLSSFSRAQDRCGQRTISCADLLSCRTNSWARCCSPRRVTSNRCWEVVHQTATCTISVPHHRRRFRQGTSTVGTRNEEGSWGDSSRVPLPRSTVVYREMFNIFSMGISMVIALDAAGRNHRHPRENGASGLQTIGRANRHRGVVIRWMRRLATIRQRRTRSAISTNHRRACGRANGCQ